MAYVVRRGKLVFTSSGSGPHGARRRGEWNRRIMAVHVAGKNERSYHATKGWRSRRVTA